MTTLKSDQTALVSTWYAAGAVATAPAAPGQAVRPAPDAAGCPRARRAGGLASLSSWSSDSLYRGGLLTGQHFAGLSNYRTALSSGEVQASAGRTGLYAFLVLPAELVLGFGMALLFKTLGDRARFLRTVFIYPLLIAPLVAGLLWQYMLAANYGILNQLLASVGILHSDNSILWFGDPTIALLAVAIPDIWLTTSFVTLVLFAGLQALPGDVYEAAKIDGAGAPGKPSAASRCPCSGPVIAVVLVIRLVDAMVAFAVILIETRGGRNWRRPPWGWRFTTPSSPMATRGSLPP